MVTFRIKSKNPLDLMKFGVILNTIFREMPTGSRNSVWIVCGVRCAPLNVLHTCGVETAQGYLFSRPIPVEEYEEKYL